MRRTVITVKLCGVGLSPCLFWLLDSGEVKIRKVPSPDEIFLLRTGKIEYRGTWLAKEATLLCSGHKHYCSWLWCCPLYDLFELVWEKASTERTLWHPELFSLLNNFSEETAISKNKKWTTKQNKTKTVIWSPYKHFFKITHYSLTMFLTPSQHTFFLLRK